MLLGPSWLPGEICSVEQVTSYRLGEGKMEQTRPIEEGLPATLQKLFKKHYEVIDTQLVPLPRNPDILELIRVSFISRRTSHLRLRFSRTWEKYRSPKPIRQKHTK
jgi:hypothetical protein